MASPVLPLWNSAVSRAGAFERQGVTLKFPARSRSGVRSDDGMVLFAMEAAEVRVDDWGCSCRLWRKGAPMLLDRAINEERRQHCGLAVRRGMAEGFIVYGEQVLIAEELLSLRVVRAGAEYWARWGYSAHARRRQHAAAGNART